MLRHVSRRASGHEVGRELSSNAVYLETGGLAECFGGIILPRGGWRKPPAGAWLTDHAALGVLSRRGTPGPALDPRGAAAGP